MNFRKIPVAAASLLLCGILLLPVEAAETGQGSSTTFETTVPHEHSLSLVIKGKGTVTVNEESYTESCTIALPRLEEEVYTIKGDEGWETESVTYGKKDEETEAELEDDTFTAPGLYEDGYVLTVTFKEGEAPEPTVMPSPTVTPTPSPTPEVSPTVTPAVGAGGNGGNGDYGKGTTGSTNIADVRNGTVRTGDTTDFAVWAALLALSGTGIVYIGHRRKRNKG